MIVRGIILFLPGCACILAGIIPVFKVLGFHSEVDLLKLGAQAWGFAVAIKILLAASFQKRIISYIQKHFSEFKEKSLCFLYGGILTGITECGASVYCASHFQTLLNSNYSNMLAFGIGFGSVEAICLGIGVIFSGSANLLQERNSPNEVSSFKDIHFLKMVYFPFSERLMAIINHVFSCVFSTLSVQTGSLLFLFFAFFKKVLSDGFAQILHLELKKSSGEIYSHESFIFFRRFYLVLSLFCLFILFLLPMLIQFPFI